MKKKKMKKSKLEEEVKVLEQKANKARWRYENKKEEMLSQEWLPKLRKSVGKCFKYSKSYGGDLPRWPLYAKIVGIDDKNMSFKTLEFQRTSLGIVEVKLDRKFNFRGENYFDGMDYVEISKVEYNRARNSILKFLTETLTH